MKQITNEDMKKVIDEMPQDTLYLNEYLMSEFAAQQPAIFEFVNNGLLFNEDELVMILCAAEMGWLFISRTLNRNRQASAGFVYEQYCRNVELFDESDYRESGVATGIIKIINFYNNQNQLMNYLVHLLNQGVVEPGSLVRKKKFAIMLLYIKTVVDCLVLDEDSELAEIRDDRYSGTNFLSVQKSVMGYIGEYMESPAFMELTDSEQAEAETAITLFGEFMYKSFHMLPLHWNPRRSVECFTAMSKITAAEDDFIMALEPVLLSFMDFCADRGYVPAGKAIAKRFSFML